MSGRDETYDLAKGPPNPHRKPRWRWVGDGPESPEINEAIRLADSAPFSAIYD